MTDAPLHVIRGHLTGRAPLDTAVSRAILNGVSDGSMPETLQVGLPHQVVAFGRHDALAERFDEAVGIAVDHGFDPTVRIAGGRAVVFHPHVVRFAWTIPAMDPVRAMHDRFVTVADVVVETLKTFSVEARVGQLDREYCAGRYSVHARGTGKIMGSGQRLAKRAAQTAGMIVVRDSDSINDVLVPVYRALGVDMDPAVTGNIADVSDVTGSQVADRLIEVASRGRDAFDAAVDDRTMEAAEEFVDTHDPRPLA